MAQQYPWPLAYRVAVRHPRPKDRPVEQTGIGKKRREFGGTGPVHRIDRVAVVRVTERHRDEDEAAGRQEIETMLRQPIGFEHVFEQVTAKECLWPKRPQAADIGGIS